MKAKAAVVSLALAATLLGGCASKPAATPAPQEPAKPAATTTAPAATTKPADAVTTASVVDNVDALQKAMGANGTWIAATLKDLKTDKELVFDGQFKNKDLPARKLALYTQDDKHVVTARFTLTAPKLTVKSENASIQHGTFVGDVYVEAKGFNLVDATVQGNVYFLNADAQSSYKLDDKSKVTGTTGLKK